MKKQQLYLILLLMLLGGASVLVIFSKGHGCVIRNATGYHCPGCGGKRAMAELASGNFLYSLQCNLLLIPALFAISWMFIRPWVNQSIKQVGVTRQVSIILFLIVTLYTVIRNLEGMALLRP